MTHQRLHSTDPAAKDPNEPKLTRNGNESILMDSCFRIMIMAAETRMSGGRVFRIDILAMLQSLRYNAEKLSQKG